MMRLRAVLGGVFFLALSGALRAEEGVILSSDEIEMAQRHGPWPPARDPDPSNRVSGNPEAISFGRTLFFDPALSAEGTLSCASCHQPERGFTDGMERAVGQEVLDRNTPSLFNLHLNRWFGWAGDSDNLWAQSILPVLAPNELAQTPQAVAMRMKAPPFAASYQRVFGNIQDHRDQEVLVNIGKALAAFQETIVTGETPFDRFLSAVNRQDWEAAKDYPVSAQRGLSLFLGRGNCSFCHSGPNFTNGAFHDAGVEYFVAPGRVDFGRHSGVRAVQSSPYNLAGGYSDDPQKSGAWAVEQIRTKHSDFGTFRVPSLRNAALTAPYMHNGSLSDLAAVIDHYSEINIERLHADGEAILVPLDLNAQEKQDLLDFLNSLTAE